MAAADAVYVLSLYEVGSPASQQEAQQWVAHTAGRVQALTAGGGSSAEALAAVRGAVEQPPGGKQQQGATLPEPFRLREGKARYLQNIDSCMQVRWQPAACIASHTCAMRVLQCTAIWRPAWTAKHASVLPAVPQAMYDGESYEVCLTTMLSRRGAPDAVQLYRTLRAINPAPYAAWLRFGSAGSGGGGGGGGGAAASSADLQLCCCSPERFLKGDRGGLLEAKPIKGTAPRSSDPQKDALAAAELAGKGRGTWQCSAVQCGP